MNALEPMAINDWRRRTFELYAAVRAGDDPEAAWHTWRDGRDALFAHHPASPLPEAARPGFAGLPYHDYDRSLRVPAELAGVEPLEVDLDSSDGQSYRFVRFAVARFALAERECELDLYWLLGYAGGLFLPFADATSGATTYGAGRYLLDTVKGADLGIERDLVVLDFNFAYNPSCSYDARWSCPLSPPRNRLPVAVTAGELTPTG